MPHFSTDSEQWSNVDSWSAGGTLVATVFPLVGWTDSAAPTGVPVDYYVTAVDLAGNESPASNLASVTIGE
jgi:hypothetical protein